jgi:BirA family transcriptional regulator, biotin operon repressor / biotin---[acetyl-CoA-carboxylase] ligase
LTWTETTAEPDFPPLLTGRRILPGADPYAEAVAGVQTGELGAGDVLWDGNPTRVALAIVLEPEVPLAKAAQMLPLAMVAMADCVGALAPPQVAVMLRWPRTITVNGAAVGEIRAACDTDVADHIPDWLVVSVDLRMRLAPDAAEPGRTPDRTTLADEGCEELTNLDVIGSFTRHFLTWLNNWQDEGLKAVQQNWLRLAEDRDGPRAVDGLAGTVRITGMDEDGNLLVRNDRGEELMLPLLASIETQPERG